MKRLLLVLALLGAPAYAQHNMNILKAAAGGCAGSPDFSAVSVFVTWDNGACTTRAPAATYTTSSTIGEYPNAMSMTHEDPDTGGTADHAGRYNADTFDPFDSCSLDIDNDASDGGAAADALGGYLVSVAGNSIQWPTGDITILCQVKHDTGDDDPSTTPIICGLGPDGDNQVQIRWSDEDDVTAFVRDSSSGTTSYSTASDSSSSCCNSGNCQNLFADGDTHVDKPVSIMGQFTSSTDTLELFIDGCSVGSASGTWAGWDWKNNDDLLAGSWNSGEAGDWRVGMMVIANGIVDLHDLISGGDDTMTDGNECDCSDVSGGSACGFAD